ncbi:MAG TPA: hypothetical protein VFI52_00470 [Gemmatimonadaceae bacterium]|nr:hypothetical protein [Gemmatimonadaceae bacterium]
MLRSRNVSTTNAPAVGETGAARTLRIILGARAVWDAAFALYLLQLRARSVAELLEAFVQFAIVDGMLALAMAVAYLVVAPRYMLWLSPATDAATRGVLVTLALLGPGIPTLPLTAVLFVGLVATFAFADGALDLVEGLSLDRELGHGSGWLPLVVSGSVAMVVGVALFFLGTHVDLLRLLLAALTGVHGAAFAFGTRHVSALLESRGGQSVRSP